MKTKIYTRASTAKHSTQLKTVLYTRIRADNQKEQLLRSEQQEKILREFAIRNNMVVITHYHDNCSVNDLNKPRLEQFFKDVESEKIKPDIIICASLDRIARNYENAIRFGNFLHKYNIKLEIAFT